MNKKIFLIAGGAVVLVLVIGWFIIFGRTNALLSYVPDNAIVVGKVNVKSILSKMDLDKVKKTDKVADQLDDVKNEMPDFLAEAMDSPLSTGLDPFQDPVGFVTFDKKTEQPQFCLLVSVQDREKLAAFLKKLDEEFDADYKFRADDDRDFEKAYPGKEYSRNHAVAWNDDILVFAFQQRRYEDDTMLDLVEKILFLDDEKRLEQFDAFQTFSGNLEDADVYVNVQAIKKNAKTLDLPDYYKDVLGNVDGLSYHLGFQDEAVDLSTYLYYKDDSKAAEKNIFGEPVDPKVTNFLTSNGKAIGAMSVSLQMNNVMSLLKTFDKEGNMSDELKTNYDLSLIELGKLFNGTMAASLTEYKKVEITYYTSDWQYDAYSGQYNEVQIPNTYEKTIPIVTAQFGIGNAGLANKLLAKLEELEVIVKKDKVYELKDNELGAVTLVAKNDRWIISNDSKAVNLVGNGEWQAPKNDDLVTALTSDAMGMFMSLDLKDYGKREDVKDLLSGSLRQDLDLAELEDLTNILKDVNVHGNMKSVHITLALNPGEGNSLYRLSKALVDVIRF